MTIFISLARWKRKPTPEIIREADKLWDKLKEEGGRVISAYWTIGRYDAVVTLEAPSEKAVLKALMRWGDLLSTETMPAIPREEAVKLLA